MREHTLTDAPVCMNCGSEIHHEPFMHMSALNILFIACDFECAHAAYATEVRRLCNTHPNKVEAWLEATA